MLKKFAEQSKEQNNNEKSEQRQSRLMSPDEMQIRVGSPGTRRNLNEAQSTEKRQKERSIEFQKELQKMGLNEMNSIEQMKSLISNCVQELRQEQQSKPVSQQNYLPFEKRVRSNSPPIPFGGLKAGNQKLSVLAKKKIAIVDLFSNCGDSTQASSRMGTFDQQKSMMKSQLKDLINNKLDQLPGDGIEEQEFVNFLCNRISETSADKELDKWLEMQDLNDNPFDVVQDQEDDFENIKESLVTSKSESDLPRDSDWMYQTRVENRIY